MNKTTLLTVAIIVTGLGFAIWAMSSTTEASRSKQTATTAPSAQQQQLGQCAAYYEISSGTIKRMGVARMASVADRLAASSVALKDRLITQTSPEQATQIIADSSSQLLGMLSSPDQLGPLMQKFKQPCQELLLQTN